MIKVSAPKPGAETFPSGLKRSLLEKNIKIRTDGNLPGLWIGKKCHVLKAVLRYSEHNTQRKRLKSRNILYSQFPKGFRLLPPAKKKQVKKADWTSFCVADFASHAERSLLKKHIKKGAVNEQ